jgi:hypothetical protein
MLLFGDLNLFVVPINLGHLRTPRKRPRMIWEVDFEYQCLVIQVKPTLIRIREIPTIEKPILGDEIIVTETENKPFVIVSNETIDGNDADTFPFLVQEARVLITSVVD